MKTATFFFNPLVFLALVVKANAAHKGKYTLYSICNIIIIHSWVIGRHKFDKKDKFVYTKNSHKVSFSKKSSAFGKKSGGIFLFL